MLPAWSDARRYAQSTRVSVAEPNFNELPTTDNNAESGDTNTLSVNGVGLHRPSRTTTKVNRYKQIHSKDYDAKNGHLRKSSDPSDMGNGNVYAEVNSAGNSVPGTPLTHAQSLDYAGLNYQENDKSTIDQIQLEAMANGAFTNGNGTHSNGNSNRGSKSTDLPPTIIISTENTPLLINDGDKHPLKTDLVNGAITEENGEVDSGIIVVDGEESTDEELWVKPSWLPKDLAVLYLILCSNLFLSSFLVFIPLGIFAHLARLNEGFVFTFNFLAIIPLAWILGAATEEIATRTNPTLGGLLNASFGNAVELIVSLIALRKGYIKLVQTSLLGSILSNMLLVLGMSFFLGGLRYRLQNFNRKGAQIFSSMLLLACLAISIPSAYVASFTPQPSLASVLAISRATALVVFVVYLCYLFFQLYTHQDVFEAMEEEEEEESDMSLLFAIGLLSAVTACVAICSEYLVDSIEPITKSWGINEAFVGIILLPIVGNAAEHATAVTVAMKNKLDLSIGVAIGSSTQIALFLIPFITLLGWIINEPMTLNFTMFETIVLVLSVVIVNFIIKDGEANWLVGLMLCSGYFIIGTAYFFHPNEPENQGDV